MHFNLSKKEYTENETLQYLNFVLLQIGVNKYVLQQSVGKK